MKISRRVTASGALFTGKAPEVVQKNLDRAITSATLLLHREVVARTPQGVFGAQGGLIGSIMSEVTGKGTPMVKGVVGTAQKYAEVIEKGRKPGKMPPASIQASSLKTRELMAQGGLVQWIMLKFNVDMKKAIQLEYVVRRSIGRKGFKGAHMFEKALDANIDKIEAIFAQVGLTITRELSE